MTISELEPMTVAGAEAIATNHEYSPTNANAKGAVTAPVLLFELPPEDREFFNTKIGHEVQRDVRRMLSFARTIHESGNVEGTCKRLAAQLAKTDGDANGNPPRGWAWKSILRKYHDYTRKEGCTRIERGQEVHYERGDWRVFWDKAKWPEIKTGCLRTATRDSALAPAFIQFLRANHDNNQRGVFSRWYDELVHIWRTHHALNDLELPDRKKVIKAGQKVPYIPGYSAWPAPEPDTGIPAGWSLANLGRKCERDDFERDAATIGKAAASQHRVKVHTSRVPLLCGEFYEFDDHEFNVKVIYPGQLKFLRPRGFFAIDVLSASCFARGLKPTLWDAQLQKKEALTEEDFMWFVVSVLTRYGFRPDERGTTLVVERGTAAIREEFERRITDATHGKVKVSRGGKFQARAHIGQLDAAKPGRGKGNYRFKALVESHFNLVDNVCGSLPGQTGLNRDRCPEQLGTLESQTRELMIALRNDPSLDLDFAMLTWPRAFWLITTLLDFVDDRKRHEIEGWRKLNFVTQPLLTPTGEIAVPSRLMSPKEVFAARRGELQPLPLHELPALLGPEHCYRTNGKDTVEIRNGVVTIDNEEWTSESDPIRFLAVDYHGDRLKNGERYRAYLNPFDTSVLVLTDGHNRALAECHRFDAAARNDLDAVKRLMGVTGQWQAKALEKQNIQHVAAGAEIARRNEQNGNATAGRNLADEPKRLSEEEELRRALAQVRDSENADS
jgi:hypothetical protein